MGWFGRRKGSDRTGEMDVEAMLRRAEEEASAYEPPPPVAPGPGETFALLVQDVFYITGRGTVATGRIDAGTVRPGTVVTLTRDGQRLRTVEVTGVESFRKLLDSASQGQNVGLLLAGVSRDDIQSGDVLSA